MAMGKHSLGIQNRDAADNGPRGGAIVDTETMGQPSVDSGAKTQSPASLMQPKGPTAVTSFDGSEDTPSNQC